MKHIPRFSHTRTLFSNPVVLSLISGVLLVGAYSSAWLWPLCFIALVPLFFALRFAKNIYIAIGAVSLAYVFYIGVVLSFIFDAYPLSWAGIETQGGVAGAILIFAWLSSVVAFVLPLALWGGIAYLTRSRFSLAHVVFLSTLWVVAEMAGAFFFSLIHIGPGMPLSLGWALNNLGYMLAEFPPLLALSKLGGVFVLSFFVVLVNCTLYFALARKRQSSAHQWFGILGLIGIFCGTGFMLYGTYGTPEDAQTIAVANVFTRSAPHTFETAEAVKGNRRDIDRVIRSIRDHEVEPNIVLLPESTRYMSLLTEYQRERTLDTLSSKEAVIVDSERIESARTASRSTLAFYYSDKRPPERYVKRLLVPGGEYMTYLSYGIDKLLLPADWSENFNSERAFTPGDKLTLGEIDGVRFAALSCSELISPFLYQQATRDEARLLLNSASHAIFGTSQKLIYHIQKIAKVRATENNRYLIQSSNTAPSFAVTNKGELFASIQDKKPRVLYLEIPAIERATFYSRYGETVPVVFVFLALALSTGVVATRRRGDI